MKVCPFCAEEIQDAAMKCRYCGSDLRPSAPSARGILWYRVGERYLLGVHYQAPRAGYQAKPDYVGIWDAVSKGEPIGRWSLTKRGWEEAGAKYIELQPAFSDADTVPGCPRCGNPMTPITSEDRLLAKASGVAWAGGWGLALAGSSRARFGCRYDKVQL